ncbi:MAG TPA: hypothetical protein VFV10_17205 [Gammaproteobacteria bacterium]|nr:hypothetical protein [Gammaproteobacteria bacterium]
MSLGRELADHPMPSLARTAAGQSGCAPEWDGAPPVGALRRATQIVGMLTERTQAVNTRLTMLRRRLIGMPEAEKPLEKASRPSLPDLEELSAALERLDGAIDYALAHVEALEQL